MAYPNTFPPLDGNCKALLLLMEYHSCYNKVRVLCDNSGIISKCSRQTNNSLKHQRIANLGLFLTQSEVAKDLDLKLEWIRSHSDKSTWNTIDDLKKQNL
jgi:ribonuclease HI